MKPVIFLLCLLFGLVCLAQTPPTTQPPETKAKPGDILIIIVTGEKDHSGEFTVLSDGTISGRGFQQVYVWGKTLTQIQKMVLESLKKKFKDPEVEVFFKTQKQDVVFLVTPLVSKGGPLPLTPNMDLRRLLSQVDFSEDPLLVETKLFRGNQPPINIDLSQLLRGKEEQNLLLQPGDLITILPKEYLRIWVTGEVAKPGLIRVAVGSDVYQAIAQAGGNPHFAPSIDADVQIFVRRGSDTITVPLRQEKSVPALKLEPGDSIVVQPAPRIRVRVAGEVKKPGDLILRSGVTLTDVIIAAGGATERGSVLDIYVYRQDELIQTKLSSLLDGSKPEPFPMQEGDLVYVRPNERSVLVLGTIKTQGKHLIEVGKTSRLADVLAIAGGLSDKGTLRRVYLARAGKDGRIEVKRYNLDEFLKDGKIEANPEVLPGDIILFGEPKGVNLNNLTQFLSSVLFIEQLFRR